MSQLPLEIIKEIVDYVEPTFSNYKQLSLVSHEINKYAKKIFDKYRPRRFISTDNRTVTTDWDGKKCGFSCDWVWPMNKRINGRMCYRSVIISTYYLGTITWKYLLRAPDGTWFQKRKHSVVIHDGKSMWTQCLKLKSNYYSLLDIHLFARNNGISAKDYYDVASSRPKN